MNSFKLFSSHNSFCPNLKPQGVFGFPNCPGELNYFCNIVRDLLNYGVYTDAIQAFLVQARVLAKHPLKQQNYNTKRHFLKIVLATIILNSQLTD